MKPLMVGAFALCMFFALVWPAFAFAPPEPASLIEQAQRAIARRDFNRAIEIATAAIERNVQRDRAYLLRASAYADSGRSTEAIADLDRLIDANPKRTDLLEMRGTEQFKLGKFKAAIADFDRECRLEPRREPWHWKRGLAYYYAGEYEKGRDQFQRYHDQEDNDVENAVWRVMCMARLDGVGLQKAQQQILIVRRDPRVPMMEAYQLFAGRTTPEQVLKAIDRGDPDRDELNRRIFYGNLYVGLYYDMIGKPQPAMEHLEKAVGHRVDHFMWHIARLHLKTMTSKSTSSDQKK
jgi:lipoprotein NlpI